MSRTSCFPVVVVAFLWSSFVVSPGSVQGQGRGRGQAVTLPDGPGKETVQAHCTKCHALNLIANSGGYTQQGWNELIGTMVNLPADQKADVTEYLAKNFPE